MQMPYPSRRLIFPPEFGATSGYSKCCGQFKIKIEDHDHQLAVISDTNLALAKGNAASRFKVELLENSTLAANLQVLNFSQGCGVVDLPVTDTTFD